MNSVTPQKRTTPATGEEEIAKKQRTEESDKPRTEDSDKPRTEESDKPRTEEADKPRTEEADKPRTEESDKPSTPLFVEDSVQDEDVTDCISDEQLAKLYLTREDLRTLSKRERRLKTIINSRKAIGEKGFLTLDDGPCGYIKGKRYGPDDPLPHGYVWVSYDPDLDYKDYIMGKECFICKIGGDHWTEECLKYDPNKKDAYCWP